MAVAGDISASDWRARKNQLPVAHNKDDILHTNLVLRLKERENKAGAGAEEEDDGSSSSVAARRCSLQRSCPTVRPSVRPGIEGSSYRLGTGRLLPLDEVDGPERSPPRAGEENRRIEIGRTADGRRQSRAEQSRLDVGGKRRKKAQRAKGGKRAMPARSSSYITYSGF